MLCLARSAAATTLRRTYRFHSQYITTTQKPSNMASTATATPYQVHISPQNTGLWKIKQTEDSAKKTTELLQKDLEEHHVFFNEDGFHNHIPHHLLALYGTGAPADAIQKGYDGNKGYQRHVLPNHTQVIEELQSWDHAKKYLGQEKYYPDFLRFFQKEMEKKGWQAVMSEYVFKGGEAADDLFARLFAGFVHPLIQLMYGLEWGQPAIIAEALAQTCVHGVDIKSFLLEAEAAAAKSSPDDMPSIWSLYEAVKADSNLAGSVRMADANKVRDGVLVRARPDMVKVAARVKVKPEELEERTVEMYNSVVAMASAAAIHPPNYPKFDFFLMHHVNSSPILLTINAQSWIPVEVKVRVLEWKIRMDLLQYAGRGVTPLSLDPVKAYKPNDESGKTLNDVISRLHHIDDDGHAIKLGRAAGVGHHISTAYEGKGRLPLEGDEVWMKVFHLIVDSVQTPGPTWVRTAGLDEAWKNVPNAKL